jgi:hypothetical protein
MSMMAALPLLIISVVILVMGDLRQTYALGLYVELGFTGCAGFVCGWHLSRFLLEGRRYHQVIDGLRTYYLAQYDRAYRESRASPTNQSVAMMNHWHQRLASINKTDRWPLGNSGKIVTALGFGLQVLVFASL